MAVQLVDISEKFLIFTMSGIVELVIFIGLVYWFFNDRAVIMVDVISARLQEAYVGWRQRSSGDEGHDVVEGSAAGQRLTEAALRRAALHHRRRQMLSKEVDRLARDSSLFKVKEQPANIANVVPLTRPFMGLSCSKCTPSNTDSLVGSVRRNTSVINILQLSTKNMESEGFLCRSFCDIVDCYRRPTFDYKQVSQTVMIDERLRKAIEEVTQETLNAQKKLEAEQGGERKGKKEVPLALTQEYKKNERRARDIVMNMRSTISGFLLKLTSWTLYKLLPYFVSAVSASPAQMSMLKVAASSGLPLIFIPLHRSHLDYILVSFIMLNHDIRNPLVAAGDNLKIPFFGWLLRGLGAFYIKRRLEPSGSKDTLYRAALHTYMMHCLQAKHNIEFFIEGSRSRTGKPQLPKGGILSVIVDAYLDGTIDDALLVPVSMNYEKLVDGNFVREQLGTPKRMETFGAAISAIWSVLNDHYGSIRIDVNQPFSLRELVVSFQKQPSRLCASPVLRPEVTQGPGAQQISIHQLSLERTLSSNQSCSSLYGTEEVGEEQKGLVEAIARHVVYDCTQATAVMSTNAVAFTLLTLYRNGCTLEQLAQAVGALTRELTLNRRDTGYTGEPVDVVNHAVSLLGPGLITKERVGSDTIIRPVSLLPNIIELSYYSNCLQPYYALQSIVATAIESLSGGEGVEGLRLQRTAIVETALQLCEVMSQEFILCKPCQSLQDLLGEALDQMLSSKVLLHAQQANSYLEEELYCRRIASSLEDDEVVYKCPSYLINQDSDAIRERCRLQLVLQPLLEVYCVTMQCLPRLLPPSSPSHGFPPVSEADYVQDVLAQMKLMLSTGACKYGEALSTDGIKNCLRLLRLWGVVELRMEGRTRQLAVAAQYQSPEKLSTIHQLVSRFRLSNRHINHFTNR